MGISLKYLAMWQNKPCLTSWFFQICNPFFFFGGMFAFWILRAQDGFEHVEGVLLKAERKGKWSLSAGSHLEKRHTLSISPPWEREREKKSNNWWSSNAGGKSECFPNSLPLKCFKNIMPSSGSINSCYREEKQEERMPHLQGLDYTGTLLHICHWQLSGLF